MQTAALTGAQLELAAAPILAVAEDPAVAVAVAARSGIAEELAAQYLGNLAAETRYALELLGRAGILTATAATTTATTTSMPSMPSMPSGGCRVLEVGAGTGLVATILSRAGVAITALEPIGVGFDVFAHIRAELEARLPELVPLLNCGAQELDPQTHGQFDVIFSVNVLEHCRPLAPVLRGIASVLAPGGHMLHCCPNYRVPYEPHLGAPLVPFAPALTARLWPRLAQNDVWRSLNFITAGDLRRFARDEGLTYELWPGVIDEMVRRLERDPAFARRQRFIGKAAQLVARTGFFRALPAGWQSPMIATFHRPA